MFNTVYSTVSVILLLLHSTFIFRSRILFNCALVKFTRHKLLFSHCNNFIYFYYLTFNKNVLTRRKKNSLVDNLKYYRLLYMTSFPCSVAFRKAYRKSRLHAAILKCICPTAAKLRERMNISVKYFLYLNK